MRRSLKRRVGLVASGLIGSMAVAVTAASPAAAATCTPADSHGVITCTYDYTGSVQQFTVPAEITSITVDLYGASGGDDAHTDGRDDVSGGDGSHVQAKLAVTPGAVYDVVVGQEGIFDSSAEPSGPGGFGEPTQAAYNGGGPGTVNACGTSAQFGCEEGNVISAGGGGATDLRPEGGALAARLIVAGGGGGAGGDFRFRGLGEQVTVKGYTGGDGDADGVPADLGGKAGTGSAGGAGGSRPSSPYVFPGTDGTEGSGGIGGAAAGGGGGGLWGGGGGAYGLSGLGVPGEEDTPIAAQLEFGGGGGGSSYTGGSGVSDGSVTEGANDGDGKAVISYDTTPDVDLAITKTDGVTSVLAGSPTTYTITATNAGPNDATGVKVKDAIPAGLTSVTWSSVAAGGATGNTANGSGDIDDTVDLPSGSSITWTVEGTVSASATGTVVNKATIAAASGFEDSNDGNNSATDTDTITLAPGGDADGDGLTNGQEDDLGTDPSDPDSDDDGLKDGTEVKSSVKGWKSCKTDPLESDTDGDGLSDKSEIVGIDLTTKVFTGENVPKKFKRIGVVKPNPCVADTDGDKLSDGSEVEGNVIDQVVQRIAKYGPYTITTRSTNPLVKDTDSDGLSDRQEVTGSLNVKHANRKSDPTVADTDWGGAKDGKEVKRGSDPTRAGH